MYTLGNGVSQDFVTALSWYQKAASQGNARAQYNIGVMYDTGKGVERNEEQAVHWLREAAAQGFPLAEIYLRQRLTEKTDFSPSHTLASF